MVAAYDQVSFPYGTALGFILAFLCIGFVVFMLIRLIRERQNQQELPKRTFRILWCIGAGVCSFLLLLVSWNSYSVHSRLMQALKSGQYETWTGVITDVAVENKGKDFQRKDVYKITLTLDNCRQFTCCWLTPEQILLLQKGKTISVSCASHVGSVTVKNGLTIYQSPDAKGNVVQIEFY